LINRFRCAKIFARCSGLRIRTWTVAAIVVAAVAFAGYQFFRMSRPLPEDAGPAAPELAPMDVAESFRRVDGVFERNQTISQVLSDHGLGGDLVQQIISCAQPVYNLAMVRAGYPFRLRFDSTEQFYDFEYPIDSDRYLLVCRDDAGSLLSEIRDFPFEIRVEEVSAAINSSLFLAIGEIGEKDQLAWHLEDIFSSDIDFFIDLRKGDVFKAIVEKKYLDGEFSGYGAVLAASFVNDGRHIMGFRFEDAKGNPAYFDAEGKCLKKSFLKSPLKYTRISSKFSLARRHPITKKVQPHLGVDYAAPVGTAVRAVGSGRVVSAGAKGANGKMVHLRHPNGYETRYLHLSRIAVKAGASVAQGDLIGYVGSSGLSMGPHLDFRIQRFGKPLNPLTLIFPPGEPVPAEKMEQFAAVRDAWMGRLLPR